MSASFGPRNKSANLGLVALALICAVCLISMAYSLASINWKYGLAWYAGGTQTAINVLLILSGICFGLVPVFWKAPWSEATLEIHREGLTLNSNGLISFAETHLEWKNIVSIQYSMGAYRNDKLDFHYNDSQSGKSGRRILAARAVGTSASVLIDAIVEHASLAGYYLDGPPIKGSFRLFATWKV